MTDKEKLELAEMDILSLTNEKNALVEAVAEQKAEIERKTKHIADITDEYARFKVAAKRQEQAKVRNIEQVADEEINRLMAENNDLFYKLHGVMWSVDKWLEGDELKKDEVNRAIIMREKTLRIVEEKEAEIKSQEIIIERLKECVEEAYTEGMKELAEKVKDLFDPEDEVIEEIDNIVEELTKAKN